MVISRRTSVVEASDPLRARCALQRCRSAWLGSRERPAMRTCRAPVYASSASVRVSVCTSSAPNTDHTVRLLGSVLCTALTTDQ